MLEEWAPVSEDGSMMDGYRCHICYAWVAEDDADWRNHKERCPYYQLAACQQELADKEKVLDQMDEATKRIDLKVSNAKAKTELVVRRMLKAEQALATCQQERAWMRREIERVGEALYTNAEGHYIGTEDDLKAIGQTVEGVIDSSESCQQELEALRREITMAIAESLDDPDGANVRRVLYAALNTEGGGE